MGKAYSSELSSIPQTMLWSQQQAIKRLQTSIQYCHDKSVLAVGSGGSFTVAAYAAALHEFKSGKLSRPASPLEVCTGFRLDGVAVILLSAEGKNKDILAAAESIAGVDCGSIALTLTPSNPLIEFCERSGAATPVGFEMPWKKDGYLATNSLIAMMTLLARAYADAGRAFDTSLISDQWIEQRRRELQGSQALADVATGAGIVVLYGGLGKVAAIDLESKLAEAALGSCQPVDYRQFAHGRHLQLAGDHPPVVIAFGGSGDEGLMNASLTHFPPDVQVLKIVLPADFALGELVGVIHAMLIVEAISSARQIDVGQPTVPDFGRGLYGTDVRETVNLSSKRSAAHLFGKIPQAYSASSLLDSWVDAGLAYISRLEAARLKGVVLDFDGTCCYTPRRFEGLDSKVAGELERLLDAGIAVAFATGRGDSLQEDLRLKLHHRHWHRVLMGFYSGSSNSWLSEGFIEPPTDPRFSSLHAWLIEHGLISSLHVAPKIHGGQMGIRLEGNHSRDAIMAAIAYWLDLNGYQGWRVFCSAHSIDVLTEKVGKRKVVENFSHLICAEMEDQLLRIGDSGHFGGNDYELLSDGIGLSVATVSPLKTSGWNFLPKKLHGAAGTYHYLSSLEIADGNANFSKDFLSEVRTSLINLREAR